MAQQVLNTLNVRPGGTGHSGGGVLEIVGAGIRPADTGSDPLERFVKRGYGKMPPQLVSKHQVVRIAPQRPGGEPVLRLALALCPQILKSNFRRFNLPGFTALGTVSYVVLCATLFSCWSCWLTVIRRASKSTWSQDRPRHSPSRRPANKHSA